MEIRTHQALRASLCGEPVSVGAQQAVVRLHTTDEMRADAQGLVHGGFVFGLADHAAMLAVNDPFVVLGAAQTRFLAPVRVGECVEAVAQVESVSGRKHTVHVTANVGDTQVFTGTFTTFVLDSHVLEGRSS